MSYSDSELTETSHCPCRAGRRKLHVELKAKNAARGVLSKCQLSLVRGLVARGALRPRADARLLSAVAVNNTELVAGALRAGADANARDAAGRGALHVAASKGFAGAVRLLLERGADPDAKDVLRNTPLHLAACTHNLQVISLLLKAGASVRRLDGYGKSPLQIAESKLQLLHRGWRQGSIEMLQVRAELELIVDILISVGKSQAESTNLPELELMKMSLKAGNVENVDDQMCKLLSDLQGFKLS